MNQESTLTLKLPPIGVAHLELAGRSPGACRSLTWSLPVLPTPTSRLDRQLQAAFHAKAELEVGPTMGSDESLG